MRSVCAAHRSSQGYDVTGRAAATGRLLRDLKVDRALPNLLGFANIILASSFNIEQAAFVMLRRAKGTRDPHDIKGVRIAFRATPYGEKMRFPRGLFS
jgi:hypothetical protein